MPLHIFISAILCISSAFTISVNDEDMDNQILVTGEVTLTDCQVKDFSRWEKLMTMMENSHMRQNMLLQNLEEVKGDIWMQANATGSCSSCLESLSEDLSNLLDSKCKPDSSFGKNVEKSAILNQDIADRLLRIENLLKKREEADQNKAECIDKAENDALLTQKLDALLSHIQRSENWINQRQLPSGCDSAILFPMRSPKIYASVHPAEMSLQAFTVCVWTKVTEALERTIVISYGTKRNPYEIQVYLNQQSLVMVVGGDKNKISADNVLQQGFWSHLCGTWNSEDGKATLWVNGENKAAASEMAQGHSIPGRGIFQLGQEKNGCCVGGGFDESLSFSGKITGFNLWNVVLSDEAILETAGESGCSIRGNVVGWGTTEIQPHGGAQYIH
ncbi:pentraxin-related protein PTX3 [Gastrophryne carolinensis]